MIERISEIKGLPVIGRYYLVPCVNKNPDFDWPRWLPVIGPVHHDKEYINIAYLHLHYDLRFVNSRLWRLEFPHVKVSAPDRAAISVVACLENVPIVERKMKCVRQMPPFPLAVKFPSGRTHNAPWVQSLENAFKDKIVNTACARCPHKGLPLNGLPEDEKGNVICPGHGLKWNLHTGQMVSRLK